MSKILLQSFYNANLWTKSSVLRNLSLLISGALVTFSLAPYSIWPLGIICPAILALHLQNLTAAQAFRASWVFGLGMYLSGVSWVYIAIHDFGMTETPLAAAMTAMFVCGLALVFALPFWLFGKFLKKNTPWKLLVVFPATWVLGEWLRTWLLTGFPWLFIGYGHLDTYLAGWAPLFGVLGVSLGAVLSGTALITLIRNPQVKFKIISGSLLFMAWVGGLILNTVSWTDPKPNKVVSVALIQPNIPLEKKWDPAYRPYIIDILKTESANHWDKDIIVWPEASIPTMYNHSSEFLMELSNQAKESNTALLSGILFDQIYPRKFFNSIVGLGDANGIYFKQRLVPFGEYVPLEKYLRGLINFFNLPNSVIHKGPKNQSGLTGAGLKIAPFICYEIVYPDLVAKNSKDADLLVTISNDAWFGKSIGPIQHFEMTRMRALENGRYVVRSTNTGISGIIDSKGKVKLAGEQFTQNSFHGSIVPMMGFTPFSQWGSLPIIAICLLAFSIGTTFNRRASASTITGHS